MKKYFFKSLIIFLTLILFVNVVNAAKTYTAKECGVEADGKVKLCYGPRDKVGDVDTVSCDYTIEEADYIQYYDNYNKAKNAERHLYEVLRPSCCKDNKDGCAESSICKTSRYQCEMHECSKKKMVTITYSASSCNPKTKQVEAHKAAGSLCNPTSPGKIFAGWNTSVDGKGSTITSKSAIHDNITVYPMWNVRLTYNINCSKLESCSSCDAFKDVKFGGNNWGELCNPQRNGYKFQGWFNGYNRITSSSIAQENITVTAKWETDSNSHYCPPGKYFRIHSTTCELCPKGNYYCPGGTLTVSHTKDVGKYECPKNFKPNRTGTGSSYCYISCKAGTYYDPRGKSCKSCESGKTSEAHTVEYRGKDPASTHNKCFTNTKKVTCNKGTYLPAGKLSCSTCVGTTTKNGKMSRGNYCPGGTFTYNTNKLQGMIQCPTSKPYSNYGAKSSSECYAADRPIPDLTLLLENSNTELALTDNEFYSTKSKVFADMSNLPKEVICPEGMKYYVKCKKYIAHPGTNCKETTKDITVVTYNIKTDYTISSGDAVYCLQPGKLGPGKDCLDYVENKAFNINNCISPFSKMEDGKKVYNINCGLAQILYQTVKYDSSKKAYVSNGKYSNSAISTALRLWVAAYFGLSSGQIGLGNMDEVSDDEDVDWFPKKGHDYYTRTANLIKGTSKLQNYNNLKKLQSEYLALYEKASNKKNVIRCRDKSGKELAPSKCSIYQALQLFKMAENTKQSNYLGGENFTGQSSQITIEPIPSEEKYSKEYKIGLPEEIQRLVVEKDCKDINNKACTVDIKVYDASGKELDKSKVDIEGYCQKDLCQIKITYKMLCDEITTQQLLGKDHIRVYIRNWYENEGWIRFYKAKKDPDKYQQMISFVFKKKYCEDRMTESKTETYYDYPVTLVECPTCQNKCEDLTKTKKLKTNCNNDDTITVNVDPDMNCIINACEASEKLKYDETDKVGANVNICHIYCREDNEFYLAPKTTVYTGMRFSYDIRPSLLKAGKVSSSFNPEQKLTSIVLQKKQCTSEIKYNSWKAEFDKINEAIKNEKNSATLTLYKNQLNTWISELKKCNLYDDTNIKQELISSLTTSTSLDFNYEDDSYGSSRKMDKVTNGTPSQTKYCSNSGNNKCYKYEENKEVTLNGSNNTTKLKYCNGSNCNNEVVVPTNDYAAFSAELEIGFYQPYKYYAEEYTGSVVLESKREKDKTYLKLPDYEYPVKLNAAPGTYKVNYKFSSVGKLNDYNYSCTYDVVKRPIDVPEDPDEPGTGKCEIINKDGSIDLRDCPSGVVFRNVDLNNLFPTEREYKTNWTNKEEVIREIQDSASTIFSDEDKHLEYRYTLTPDAIEQIKEYNTNHNIAGGYLNETLSCNEGTDVFVDCKSSFLSDISRGSGNLNKVKVNKAGGR